MKKPTTEFQIGVQGMVKLNRQFLLSKGGELKEEKPLYEVFVHSKNNLLTCYIGLYGEFGLSKLHWINRTPDVRIETTNPNLTESDYENIFSLLGIEHP